MTEPLNNGSQLLSLPFDHYQRYKLTQQIIELLRPEPSVPARILDVGGASSSLKHFLPDANIVIVDIQAPPQYTYSETVPFVFDAYILGSGGNLPFDDSSFDIVTAHDTLEHVPAEYRRAFLEDLLRVATDYVIVNGPTNRPETERAELRLAQFMERANGGHNISLDEHIALGLPHRGLIEDALTAGGFSFVAIPNGNLMRWLSMMALKHYILSLPDGRPSHEALDATYNRFFAEHDLSGACYRTAYVAARDNKAGLERVAARFATGPEDRDDARVELIEPMLTSLEVQGSTILRTLAEQRHEIERSHLEAEGLREEVRERDLDIARRQAELEGLQIKLTAAISELTAIRETRGYRLLESYRATARRWFPAGSWRSLPFRAARRAVNGILSITFRAPPTDRA